MLYVVIPVFNRLSYTKACLESLMEQDYHSFKVILVDHGSTDGTSDYVSASFPKVIILKGNESMWWTAATNFGIQYALDNEATFILTLNNDLVVDKDYLSLMMDTAKKHPNAIIGSTTVNIAKPEEIAYAGTKWNEWTSKYSMRKPNLTFSQFKLVEDVVTTDLLPGRGTLIPLSVFNKIGLFDEDRYPHYLADEEFSLRGRKAGFKLFVNARAAVKSHVGDTGLNTVHRGKKGLKYLIDTFTSARSPFKIDVHWTFAKQHTKIPLLYFALGFSRIFISQLRIIFGLK